LFIYNIRCAYGGEEDKLDEFGDLITTVKDYFKDYNKGNSAKLENYKAFIDDDNPIETLRKQISIYAACDLKKNHDFIVNIMLKFIKLRFGSIKESRKYHLRDKDIKSKLDQEFTWLKIIEGMKKLSRSVSYLGLGNDRKPTKLEKLSDYFNGCKDNFLKVFASEIVKVAVKNDCKVVVMEDLGNGSVALNRKRENFIYYLWSPGRIQDAVANAARWFGISVATVPESQTSQIHFETQKYGYREKTKLYYVEKDVVKSVHADFNAAKNIILKLVTRNASMTQVFAKGIYDDDPVNEKERSGQKLQDGLLTHKFGSIKSANEFFKNRFPNEKYVYLHGGEWISKKEKDEIQDGIEKRVVK
jgi:IS605 OrfB family transposase